MPTRTNYKSVFVAPILKRILTLCFILFSASCFAQDDDKPTIKVGGALRFNYNLSSWKDGQKDRGGDFGFDLFRINVEAKHKKVKLNAEYRFYSSGFGGGMLKQGWLGYEFNTKDEIQLGLTQVPFGITQYNSHNWFFGINYYIGLEDDHDMGVKFIHRGEKWEYDIAFFKNAEELRFGSLSDVSDSRYSYDVSSIDLDGNGLLELRNKEVNQLNLKAAYKFGSDKATHKIGASTQYGGLYNLDTEKMGNHHALALHYEMKAGRYDFKLQASQFNLNAKNPESQPNDVIAMTAYGAPYLTAAEGRSYTVGMGYSVPVKWGPISNLQFYNDFGMLDKAKTSFEDSFMNVTGVLITAGNVYTYVDFAAGKNHPWLGDVWTTAFANGTPNEGWEMRFNVNIGYYF